MKTIYLIPIFLCCLILDPSDIKAQDEKHDALYLSVIKEYTLNPDGSTAYRYIKEQKLLTYRAFHNLYGETFVVYHPAYQKLKINGVYTVMADGKKIIAPENAFNEVLPGYAANAPAYNALREMVITHTGLERNSTISLDYEVQTQPGICPALMGNELLAENEPVKKLEIRVRIPAGQKLNYKLFNAESVPETVTEGKYEVFTWKFSDLPALSAEEAQKGAHEGYPRLVFSSSESPETVFTHLTNQPAFKFTLNDQMRNLVNTLSAEKKNRFELTLKIQEKVVSDIRLYPVPLKIGLYQCRTPEQTWNTNGGTVLEKAVLLATLLKAAGLEAQVVGIVRTALVDEKNISLANLEDFAVKVEDKDRGTWYFSVSGLNSVNLRLALPGRSFIVLDPDGKKISMIKAEAPKQMIKVIGKLIVSSDPKLTGEVSLYMDGSVYPCAGQLRDKKRMKNSLSGGLISGDSANVKVSTLNTENGFQTYIVKSDKPFRKDSNFYYFSLPAVTSGIDGWGIRTLSVKRETAYEIPSLADESYNYTITLPSSMRLFTPEKKIAISNKAGSFTWEVKTQDGKVAVKRQLKFNERIFEISDYEDFKILMDYWNNPWYRQLIFMAEKTGK